MARRAFKLVGVNCEPDLHAALERFASDQRVSLSQAARLLLRKALEEGEAELVAQDLADEGYLAGFRRGLAEVHQHMAKLKPRRE